MELNWTGFGLVGLFACALGFYLVNLQYRKERGDFDVKG
jgi:hypothetical protein